MNILDKPIIPSSYLLRVTTIHCQCCGVTNYASEFFAVSRVKPRMGQGAPMKHAIVCDKPLYDLPIEHQSVHRNTAFCMDCNIDLSHLPLPPSMAGLHDLAEPVLKGARPVSKPAAKAAKPALEDLA